MWEEIDRAENAVARIAARQHGVVTVEQLREAEIGKNGVTRRLRAGRLHRLHRGVYAVGHAAPSEARAFIAAVLACGKGAALSHVSATLLWGFLKPGRATRGPIYVTSLSTTGEPLSAELFFIALPP